ncbi:MAG: hypothetical protein IT240_07280, partial [Bacteroidia bacterium]|nr:hypothetical protein [Bacteroidia bacterium]
MRRGIHIRNLSPGNGLLLGRYHIGNNTLGFAGAGYSGYFNPTAAIVLFNSNWGLVDSNTIHANRQDAQTAYGIVSQASNWVTIRGNRPIEIAGTALYPPTAQASGVWISGSGDNRVCDNKMTRFGSGLTISGQSPRLMVRCNDFNLNLFSGVTISNGDFGNQGASKHPSDNNWVDADGAFRIRGGMHPGADAHEWWYRAGAATELDVNSATLSNVWVSPIVRFTTFEDAFGFYYTCDDSPCEYLGGFQARFGEAKTAGLRDTLIGHIVLNIDPDTISLNTAMSVYTDVRRVFIEMASDSTWLNTGDASDST